MKKVVIPRCPICNKKLSFIEKFIKKTEKKPAHYDDIPYCNRCKKEVSK